MDLPTRSGLPSAHVIARSRGMTSAMLCAFRCMSCRREKPYSTWYPLYAPESPIDPKSPDCDECGEIYCCIQALAPMQTFAHAFMQ
jgi:hypothetical protein